VKKAAIILAGVLTLAGAGLWLYHMDGWPGGSAEATAGGPRKTRVERPGEKAKTEAGQVAAAGAETAATAGDAGGDEKAWDWEKILSLVREQNTGMGDYAEGKRLRERIQAMDKGEMLATLDEILRLDMPQKSKAQLEYLFVDPLAQKDAATAFDRFGARMEENSGIRHSLKRGLEIVAKKDPAAASSLMDREIAKGTFEVKTLSQTSASRVELETVLAGILIDSDPRQLTVRIVNMGEDEAFLLLRSEGRLHLKDDQLPAFVNILREGLPPDKQAIAFVERVQPDGNDYTRVSRLLEETGAGEDEARRVAEAMGRIHLESLADNDKLTVETMDAYRQWAVPMAAGSIDRLTGEALRKAVVRRSLNFQQAAEIAIHCQDTGGSDEVLAVFLTAKGSFPKEAALEVAARIKDPAQREKIISYYP